MAGRIYRKVSVAANSSALVNLPNGLYAAINDGAYHCIFMVYSYGSYVNVLASAYLWGNMTLEWDADSSQVRITNTIGSARTLSIFKIGVFA